MKRWQWLCVPLAVCLAPAVFGQEDPAGRPPFRVIHPTLAHPNLQRETVTAQAAAGTTIPLWQATIIDGGKSYKYTMVGQNPSTALANQTSTVKTFLIPVILTLPSGQVFDPTKTDPLCTPQGSASSLTQASPIFQSFPYVVGGTNVGTTQYVDFFQRASFWKYANAGGVNPNYHVLLSPTALSGIKVTVPAGKGKLLSSATCGPVANIDVDWWDTFVQQTVLPALAAKGIGTTSFPLFLLYNVVMYQGRAGNCCILGYHNGLKTAAGVFQSYAVADWDASLSFSGSGDISAMSHEVGEWMDDPTTYNPTAPWGNIGQVSGCQSNLEVGDPLSGNVITVTMPNNFAYHPQEMAFFSWFYHQTPSMGVNGWYSSAGALTTAAAKCP